MITANKALLAEDGPTLFAAAEKYQRDLYFEAAVAGAIPILRPLRESLAGDDVTRVMGIVNGTTNYILDKMDTTGAGFDEALEEAQALGYAEADPTADIEGFDAAAKAALLASLAFHTRVSIADVHREGITEVSATDIASAREMGCVVKSLAICELDEATDSVSARVYPAMIPLSHPLAVRPGRVQRRLRGIQSGRPADVLWSWCRRRPDGQCCPRGSRVRRAQPAQGCAGGRRVVVHPAGRPADGRRDDPLPRVAGRGRQGRCAGGGGPRLRRARRVDPDRPPGGPGQ